MSTFELRIVTPDGLFYSGEVEYLSVQTTDGRVGFMRGALPRVGKIGRASCRERVYAPV